MKHSFRLPPMRIAPLASALLVSSLAAVLGGCSGELAQAAPQSPPAPRVQVAAPVQRELRDHAEFNGRVAAIEDVELRPRVSGYLEALHFQAGAWVEQDQLLFSIDDSVYAADLARAEAARLRAKTQLDLSEREAARYGELVQSGAVSDLEARERSDARDVARAEFQAAEAEWSLAQLNLDYTQVRAPIAGRISRALVTEGNFVSGLAGVGTVLATLVSVDPVYVYADVSEAAVLGFDELRASAASRAAAGAGLEVSMRLADEDEFARRGVIESFDNRLEPSTGSMLVRARFPNPTGELVPGLYARLRIPTGEPYRALLVPESAIGADQGQRFVWVLGPGDVPQYKRVELGAREGGLRVVKSGLTDTDLVLVSGTQFVIPGLPVAPERLESIAPR